MGPGYRWACGHLSGVCAPIRGVGTARWCVCPPGPDHNIGLGAAWSPKTGCSAGEGGGSRRCGSPPGWGGRGLAAVWEPRAVGGGHGAGACRTTWVWFSVARVDDVSGTRALGTAGGGARAVARALTSVTGEGPVDEERVCARPACRAPATATLGFSYAARQVELHPLAQLRAPQTYDLCTVHAARTRPPHGWELRDRRPDDDRHSDERRAVPADLGGDRTVAVLAAALRAVPGAVSEDAAPAPAAEVVADPAAPQDHDGSAPGAVRTAARPVPAAGRGREPARRTG